MNTPEHDFTKPIRPEERLGRDGLDAERQDSGPSMAAVAKGVTHEINNLIATIMGNAALVRSDLHDTHPDAQRLDMILRAAEEVGRLNKRLSALAQGDGENAEPVNLNALVYHAMLVEESKFAPRVRLTRYMNPDLWRVAADHAQLSQVLVQLTLNAIESIRETGKVALRTRNVEIEEGAPAPGSGLPPGRWVLVSVEDDGEGMDEATLSRAFAPGFTTREDRQGMGLPRVAEIVARHRGHITVTSSRDAGTTVRVYLPAYEDAAESRPASTRRLPRGNETILVVDDERMIADVLQETLRRLGYKTLTARNGQEAVEVARTHDGPIHLVLLDMAMPIMGGAEAYPLLKQARPEAKIILCTGFQERLVTHPLIESGADAFLLKPFRPAALAQEVRRALGDPPPVMTGAPVAPAQSE